MNWAVPSPRLILGPDLDLDRKAGHISIPRARVLLPFGEKPDYSAPSSQNADSPLHCAIRLHQTQAVHGSVTVRRSSVGLPSLCKAHFESSSWASSHKIHHHLHPPVPARDAPVRSGFLPPSPGWEWGPCQEITALDCTGCHRALSPNLRAGLGGDTQRCWGL